MNRIITPCKLCLIPSSSNSFSSLPVFTSSDESFRNRFSEEFESSIIDAAMREVKANCAEDTY